MPSLTGVIVAGATVASLQGGGAVLPCDIHPPDGSASHVEICADRAGDDVLTVRPTVLGRLGGGPGGVGAVWIERRLYFVSRTGRTAPAFVFDNGPDYFSDGLARTVRGGKVGFVDAELRDVVPAHWDFAEPFDGEVARVCVGCSPVPAGDEHATVTGGKWGYIDTSGRLVVAVAYERDAVPRPPSPGERAPGDSTNRIAGVLWVLAMFLASLGLGAALHQRYGWPRGRFWVAVSFWAATMCLGGGQLAGLRGLSRLVVGFAAVVFVIGGIVLDHREKRVGGDGGPGGPRN